VLLEFALLTPLSLSLLPTALLPTALPADPPMGDTAFGYLGRIAPPSAVEMQNYAKAGASGDFDNDLRRDLVQQFGTRAWMLLAPGVLDVWVPLSPPGAPAVRDVDALGNLALVGDSQGVRQFRYQVALGVPESRTLISGVDVREFVVGEVTEDGIPDIVVRTSNEIRTYRGNGMGEYSLHSGFAVPGTVRGIRIAHWNSPAIAVLGANTLEIRRTGGTLLHARVGKGSSTILDVGRTLLDTNSIVVWGTRSAQGQEWLQVERAGQPSEASVALSSIGMSTARLADLDGDGDSDLVASLTGSPNFYLMVNRSEAILAGLTTRHFSTAPQDAVDVQVAASGSFNGYQQAEPVLADFDNDTDIDLLLGVQSAGDFALMANFPIDEDLLYFRDGENKDDLYITMPVAGIPTPATHLVILLYKRLVNSTEYDRTPIQQLTIKVSGLTIQTINGLPTLRTHAKSLDTGWNYGDEAQAILWFERRDSVTQTILARYPTTVMYVPIVGLTDGTISGVTRLPKLGPFPPGIRPLGGTAQGSRSTVSGN
jgi:hypothetical protein